jgi:hypothetical protein
MKSLISNYLNSRRSVRIDETILDVENEEKEVAVVSSRTECDDAFASLPTETTVTTPTDPHSIISNNNSNSKQEDPSVIANLNLKFIDDNDSDSASNVAVPSGPNSPTRLHRHLLNSNKNDDLDLNCKCVLLQAKNCLYYVVVEYLRNWNK